MKQQYEHIFMYFFLIYIVKLTQNDEYVFLSFMFEIKLSRVSNTTFLIRRFQFLTNVPLKSLNK